MNFLFLFTITLIFTLLIETYSRPNPAESTIVNDGMKEFRCSGGGAISK